MKGSIMRPALVVKPLLGLLLVAVVARWTMMRPVLTSDVLGMTRHVTSLAAPDWARTGEPASCELAGEVTDVSTGLPISGAMISLVMDASEAPGMAPLDSVSNVVTTDLEGRWRGTVPPRRPVSIGVAAMGRIPRAIRVLSPCTGSSSTLLQISMARGGCRVTGIVQDSDGQPVVEALVVARPASTDTLPGANVASYVAKTDTYGVFWLPIEAGEYLVYPSHPGLSRSIPQRYLVGSGLNRIDMSMLPARSLRGQVVDTNGRNVADVLLEARLDRRTPNPTPGELLAAARSDPQGWFNLDRLPPLPLVIVASSNVGSAVLTNSIPAAEAGKGNLLTLRLRSADALEGNFIADKAGGSLPVLDQWLYARDPAQGVQYRTLAPTDVDGFFHFPMLPNGDYELFAGADASNLRILSERLHVSDDNRHDALIRWAPQIISTAAPAMSLDGSTKLAGVVRDTVGSPVANLSIVLTPLTTSSGEIRAGSRVNQHEVVVRTAADGSFASSDISPGSYVASASNPTGQRRFVDFGAGGTFVESLPIEVPPQSSVSELKLTVEECRNRIFGVTTDEKGRPLAHSVVRGRRFGHGANRAQSDRYLFREQPLSFDVASDTIATSNELGRFALLGLCEGQYRLTATNDDVSLVAQPMYVQTNESVQLALRRGGALTLQVVAAGQAVTAFRLTLVELSNGHRVTRQIRSEQPSVQIGNLPTGSYLAQIAAPEGYADRKFDTSPGHQESDTIELDRYCTVRGRLLAQSGVPIAGAKAKVTDEMQLVDPNGTVRRTSRLQTLATTDDQGYFELKQVQDHRGRLSFSASDDSVLMLVDVPSELGSPSLAHYPYQPIVPNHSTTLDLGELHAVFVGQSN